MAESSDKPDSMEKVTKILQEAEENLKGLLEHQEVEVGKENLQTLHQVRNAMTEIKSNLKKNHEKGVLSKAMEYFHVAKAAYV